MKVTVDFTQDAAAQFSTMKLILAVMTHGSGFTTLANKLCVAWSNLGMNKQTLISTGRPRQYPDCIGSAFFDASHTTTAWALQNVRKSVLILEDVLLDKNLLGAILKTAENNLVVVHVQDSSQITPELVAAADAIIWSASNVSSTNSSAREQKKWKLLMEPHLNAISTFEACISFLPRTEWNFLAFMKEGCRFWYLQGNLLKGLKIEEDQPATLQIPSHDVSEDDTLKLAEEIQSQLRIAQEALTDSANKLQTMLWAARARKTLNQERARQLAVGKEGMIRT